MKKISLLVGWIAVLSATVSLAQIPKDLQWQKYFTGGAVAETYAIACDEDNYCYAVGTTKTTSNISRVILKYSPWGTNISSTSTASAPLYTGSNNAAEWDAFSFQRLVINTDRNALYVLVGAHHTLGAGYEFFLYKHRLSSGALVWSRHVGHTDDLLGGLSEDAQGNIWVAIPEILNTPPSPALGIKVKRFSSTGTETLSSDVASPATSKTFSGLATSGDRLFLSYKEGSTALGIVDLVATVYDISGTNFAFLSRSNFSYPIHEPDDDAAIYQDPNATAVHHPVFKSATTDKDGNFVVVGYYSFRREVGCFNGYECFGTNTRFYPVMIKLNRTLGVVFEYIEKGTGQVWEFANLGITPPIVETRVVRTNGSNMLMMIGGKSLAAAKVYQVNATGVRTDLKTFFRGFDDVVSIPPNADCDYVPIWRINDLAYYSTTATIDKNRLVLTGHADLYRGGNSSDCPPSSLSTLENRVLTATYHRQFYIRPLPDLVKKPWPWEVLPEYYGVFDPGNPGLVITPPGENPRPGTGSFPPIIESDRLGVDSIVAQLKKITPALQAQVVTVLKSAPTGKYFTAQLKSATIKSLNALGTKNSGFIPAATGDQLGRALNALELDWRIPKSYRTAASLAAKEVTRFDGIINVTSDAKADVKFELAAWSPVPLKGLTPTWPLVSYNFEGGGSGSYRVSLNVGWLMDPKVSRPHLMLWNGTSYVDVTTDFDPATGMLHGESSVLGKFVVMNENAEYGKEEGDVPFEKK